jgi:hypothetical protein
VLALYTQLLAGVAEQMPVQSEVQQETVEPREVQYQSTYESFDVMR